jgi:alkyl hydroperoxide reductase subunit F
VEIFIPNLKTIKPVDESKKDSICDLIIIGAGPAGITAAVYAARKRLNFMVISKNVGGQVILTSVVENYTGYQEITGKALTEKFDEHLKQFKFDFKEAEVKSLKKEEDIFIVEGDSASFKSKTLLIATGARPKMLNIKGEQDFKNRGVTYCSTCDAPLFANKDVVVIGSGNSALDAVLQLINIANRIYLLVRKDTLKGDKIMIDKVKASPKVEILFNTTVLEIVGDKLVKGIKIDQKGEKRELAIQGVFIEIGYIPNTEFIKDFVKLNSAGEIEIDFNNQTSVAGVFAAGDCTTVPYKQIIIAAGEGSKATISAFGFLAKRNYSSNT